MTHPLEDPFMHLYSDGYSQDVFVTEQGEMEGSKRRTRKTCGEDGDGRKRKLSEEQMNFLEKSFGNNRNLEQGRKERLACEVGLDPRQVAVWFQNRRARWKTKKFEEEFSELKMAHETVIQEKHHLQTEVLKLKDQLVEKEREIGARESWGSSECSSSMIDVTDPRIFEEFGIEALEAIFNSQSKTNYPNL